MSVKEGLVERLNKGPVICAEGFIFELERRGFLASGEFVPTVVLDHPEIVEGLHREFQHAGSDIVEALTYYAHREKLKVAGQEHIIEDLNRQALRIAKKVADSAPKGVQPNLLAGNICNSNIWKQGDKNAQLEVERMFDEMVTWASEEGADLIIGETFSYAEEAFKAVEVIKKSGLPAVLTIAPFGQNVMLDGWSIVDTCKELEQRGADVVGLNCFRGPQTMLPYLKDIRKAVKCHVAALPVPYRTTDDHPTFFNLPDNNGCSCPSPHGRPFPTALDPLFCNRYEIREFAKEAYDLGVNYLGVCCGASPALIREVAEAVGLTVPASKYREKMQNHSMYGTHERIAKHIQAYGDKA